MSLLSRLLRRGAFPSHLRGVKPEVGVVSSESSSLPYPCECPSGYHARGCPRCPPSPPRKPVTSPSVYRIDMTSFDAANMTVNGESLQEILIRRMGMAVERPEMSVRLTPDDIAKGRCPK